MEKHSKLKPIVETKEPFKAYITRFALKNGILHKNLYHRFEEPSTVAICNMWGKYIILKKGEWFYTLEEALDNVEFRRQYKMNTMQKEIDKLKNRIIPIIPED